MMIVDLMIKGRDRETTWIHRIMEMIIIVIMSESLKRICFKIVEMVFILEMILITKMMMNSLENTIIIIINTLIMTIMMMILIEAIYFW